MQYLSYLNDLRGILKVIIYLLQAVNNFIEKLELLMPDSVHNDLWQDNLTYFKLTRNSSND